MDFTGTGGHAQVIAQCVLLDAPRLLAWSSVTGALLLFLSFPTLASGVACGVFSDEYGSSKLVVEAPDRGHAISHDGSHSRFALQQSGDDMIIVNLSTGYARSVGADQSGQALHDDGTHYSLIEPSQCSAALRHPADSCLADPNRCVDMRHSMETTALESACAEGVPYMCMALPEKYIEHLIDTGTIAPPGELATRMRATLERQLAAMPLPAECLDPDSTTSGQACLAQLEEEPELLSSFRNAIVAASLGLHAATVATATLPKDHRETLHDFCTKTPDGAFCHKVADLHASAGDLGRATEALELACTGGRSLDCALLEPLRGLGPDLQPAKGVELPQGTFVSSGGIISFLTFTEDGSVSAPFGQLQARLENDRIHLKHARVGELILQPLLNGDLLGIGQHVGFDYFRSTE
jgi:hypothetical protein